MKLCVLFVFLYYSVVCSAVFSQTPKSVEADLSKSFNRINYWMGKSRDTTYDIVAAGDSLDKANEVFGNKLKHYTSTYPFTIIQPFKSLNMQINTSDDGLLRIYSWDTETGGTMHYYRNVIQYKTAGGVKSILQMDTTYSDNGSYIYFYSDLHTLKSGNKTYYLGIYNGVFSTKDMEEGARIFSIENGRLNDDVKIIKTASGLHGKLSYYYDLFSIPAKVKDADIYFNPNLKTITIPVITGSKGKVTSGRIVYKFTGQYFERVKS